MPTDPTLLDTLDQARAAFDDERWDDGIPLWERLTAANPLQSTWWLALAISREGVGQHAEAIDAWLRVRALGDEFVMHPAMRIARCLLSLGDTPSALDWVQRAYVEGYLDLDALRTDDIFEPLRTDPGFREMAGLMPDEDDHTIRWQRDLAFAGREIRRRAFDPTRRLDQIDLEGCIAALQQRVPELTDAQMLLELHHLLRLLNDGHARVRVPEDRVDLQQALPLQLFCFPEGVVITAAAPAIADLAGCRILQVGDHAMTTVMQAFEPIITRDNENEYWFLRCLQDWLPYTTALHALDLIPNPDAADLTVETPDGDIRTVTVEVDPEWPFRRFRHRIDHPEGWTFYPERLETPVPLYLRHLDRTIWCEALTDDATMYVQFNAVMDQPEETLAEFGRRMRAEFDTQRLERLVLDMRWNWGGNTLQEWPLLHQIVGHSRINRRGGLFVIMGRDTFSAAQNGVNFLATHSEAVFVGEPSGSGPQFVGETNHFTLPYSGFVLNVSVLHWVGTWPGDTRRWLPPDILTPPTLDAWRENRDPALEAILAIPLHVSEEAPDIMPDQTAPPG